MGALAEALRDLDESRVKGLVEEMLQAGISPMEILAECNSGMVAVGDLFSSREYFLTELMFSAEILKGVTARLDPLLRSKDQGEPSPSLGTVVIGTVKGDVHDIGKNIVVTLLRGHGFEVVDLGVDVPAERFVQAVRDTGASLLGMSALLNFTYPEMKNVVDALVKEGIRASVKVIVGGTICDERVREYTGADYYANDAVTGIKIAREVYG